MEPEGAAAGIVDGEDVFDPARTFEQRTPVPCPQVLDEPNADAGRAIHLGVGDCCRGCFSGRGRCRTTGDGYEDRKEQCKAARETRCRGVVGFVGIRSSVHGASHHHLSGQPRLRARR